MQTEHDVFVSYNAADKSVVERLCQALLDSGVRPWFDQWELLPGDLWVSKVELALSSIPVTLICVGSHRFSGFNDEIWQAALLKASSKDSRILIALLHGGGDRNVPLLLRRQWCVDLREESAWMAGILRLVAEIMPTRISTPSSQEPYDASILPISDLHAQSMVVAHVPEEARLVSSLSDPASEPNPAATQLEHAYERREELLVTGQDTKLVDAEILGLRRALRRGPTLHPGEYLGDGRFRIVEVLGRGGFALVWKAYDSKERRLVAVKVLHGELARDPARRERLFRGAKRMADLRHPNVAQVLVTEGEDEGFHYFVMEFAPGGDLHRAVIDGRLDRDQALGVIDSIADVLTVAHESGLVHRDVKPENILLRKDGSPALSDFDLVQAQDTTGGTRTAAMGTIAYAAPEQSEDASRVDQRADVYGLGMSAVFSVYGKTLPLTAIYNRDRFMSDLACTAGVREVLRRAVALKPEDRFESMASFRRALAKARRDGGDEGVRIISERVPSPPPMDHSAPPTVSLPARPAPAMTPMNHGAEKVLQARDRVQALQELLIILFDANELRIWLRFYPEGETIVRELPGESVSKAELTFKATDLLLRRGLVDTEFFDRLRDHIPRRAAVIDHVRAHWAGT